MPTIPQLTPATVVNPTDEVPISQNGSLVSTTVNLLLGTTQGAISTATGTLLGRVSLGAGGPEPVTLGVGVELAGGALRANGTDHAGFVPQTVLQGTDQAVISSGGTPMLLQLSLLRGLFSAGANIAIDANGVVSATGAGGNPYSIGSLTPVTTIAAPDLVGINQGGADHTISYANFIDGATIDQVPPAAAAPATATLWVGQGSNVLVRQTLGAVWNWVAGHLPGYHRPVVEVTTNLILDGSVHNNAILVCSAPVMLTPGFINMGSGFHCDVINLSGGSVTFAPGITTSTGNATLATGQAATLSGASYSGGNVVFAALAASGAPAVPGQVTALAAGAVAYNAVPLTWSAPATGGLPSTYTVQYRVHGGTNWTTASSAVAGTGFTVSGLTAATDYDFQVTGTNQAGSGTASAVISATTAAAPAAPGQVTGLIASAPTAGSVTLAWTAPTGGSVSTYTVQYRITGGSVFATASASVTGLTYTVTGLAPSTGYDFQVLAVNVSGSGPASAIASATTGPALPGQPTALSAGAATASSLKLGWSAPGSGGPPAGYTVQYRITGATVWATAGANVTALSDTVTGLAASTSYDFQVIAVNATGSGPASATVTASTAAAALVAPGQVTALAAGSIAATSVALTWTAPASGGAVGTYTVNYRVTGTTPWLTASASVTVPSFSVTGLAASTSYEFEVIAVNSVGAGPASAVATAVTTAQPPAVPGQVTGLTTSAPTANSITLAWTAPSSGGPVATYTAQYRPTGGTGWTTASATLTSPGCTVTGLSSGLGYDFQVIAVNAGGSGPPSAVVSATTTLVVPGAVTGLAAGTATASAVPLSWTAPATGGAVASYTVQYRVHGATAWTTASATVNATSYSVGSLTAATSYDFQVFAVNAAGSGAVATVSASTIAGTSYVIKPGFLPPASTYTHGQTGIGINMQCDPTPPGSVLNFGWSPSATVAPTSWATQATNFNVDFYGGYMTAPATAGTYYFWASTTDAAASYVSPAITVS